MESNSKQNASEEERYPIPGPQRAPPKTLVPPLDFKRWIDDNLHNLKPPVGAYLVYDQSEDYIVFVVGGPNRRKDYHVNMSEEFFYQLRGDMVLKVVVDGEFKDVEIKEGSIFLLPANVPHSPQRKADTVGLVIERRRTPDLIDHLRFYCDGCRELLYEEELVLQTLQIGKALVPPISRFFGDVALRTCKKCGHITDTQVKE